MNEEETEKQPAKPSTFEFLDEAFPIDLHLLSDKKQRTDSKAREAQLYEDLSQLQYDFQTEAFDSQSTA